MLDFLISQYVSDMEYTFSGVVPFCIFVLWLPIKWLVLSLPFFILCTVVRSAVCPMMEKQDGSKN